VVPISETAELIDRYDWSRGRPGPVAQNNVK
jgi:hypothetical protein